MQRGVSYGRVTGLKTYGTISRSAILVDSVEVYERVSRAIDPYYGGHYSGYPGFKFSVGRYLDYNLVVGTVPPYPEAVVEAVSELYMMGVRNFILITRGMRIGRRLAEQALRDEEVVYLAIAAIPLDGVSERIAAKGVPLMPSEALLRELLRLAGSPEEAAETPEGGGEAVGMVRRLNVVRTVTITLRSPRFPWSYEEIEPYLSLRNVRLVDSVTAPLYALQYYYNKMRALSLVTALRPITPALKPVEFDYEQVKKINAKEAEIMSRAIISAVEVLKKVEEAEKEA